MPSGAPDLFQHGPLAVAMDAVQAAWLEATRLGRTDHPAFAAALDEFAEAGRIAGVGVVALLKALHTIDRQIDGGDNALDWDHMRKHATSRVIRQFFDRSVDDPSPRP